MRTSILRACAAFALAAALMSCGARPRPAAEALPAAVPGGWSLQQTLPATPDSLPEEVRQRAPENCVVASYRGPSAITVTLCRFRADASAFALMQYWRSRDSLQPFYQGPYFGTAEGASQSELLRFARAFQPLLPR